jgi:signal transduction histidine kinase
VSASSLTASVVEFLRPKAEEKRLKLAVDIQPDLFALADEEKFKEVLMNFIDNAIKYTPSGSVRVHLAAEDGAVRVAVEDTGYGLTATDREQLFEKFARGSASKQVQVSTGLGLYVCRRLVEAMGGRIWAESKGPGKGSTFLFTLPAAVASRRKSRLTKSRPGR